MELNHRESGILPDLCTPRSLLLVVVTAQLLAIVLTLAAYPLPTWSDLGLVSLYVLWTALLSTGALCVLRRQSANWPVWGVALVAWLSIVVATLLVSLAGYWLIELGRHGDWPRWPRLEQWQQLGRHLVISAIIGAVFLRYFYLQYSYRERLAAEAKARIEALHARIRPHFLFNTLNTIAELLYQDTVLAEKALHALARMFRASLTNPDALVPWTQELELSEHYLMLEKWRLGDRLEVDWRLKQPKKLSQVMVPALVLQPLLENAIVHGIACRAQGGSIVVDVEIKRDKLIIQVCNPMPTSAGESSGHGMALANIRERLRWLYGLEAGVAVGQEDDRFCVRVTLPAVRVTAEAKA
ncbi:MAG: sensor histidine kinase [Gammaproteobacteria bacterium]|nr:MAG: sensor histidine kinase [Gammaproteobacteria bacterium]